MRFELYRIASDRIGSHRIASVRIGSHRFASDRIDVDAFRIVSDRIGSHRIASMRFFENRVFEKTVFQFENFFQVYGRRSGPVDAPHPSAMAPLGESNGKDAIPRKRNLTSADVKVPQGDR